MSGVFSKLFYKKKKCSIKHKYTITKKEINVLSYRKQEEFGCKKFIKP
tara:strand:+ start:503 stop:646 length:144 start_codon:yes stop_codon:yes gene_type:complete